MEYLELTVQTASNSIEDVAAALTTAGFEDLVLEDQAEFESFLEDNRAFWDYIDEDLQAHLQGLSQIKLYIESCDTAALEKLRSLLEELKKSKENNILFIIALITVSSLKKKGDFKMRLF